MRQKVSFLHQRFQAINEIQENMMGQLMTIGRSVWGPKCEVPVLKGTEVSLSYVQCFSYLVSSPVNVSIFHSTWLVTFWTDLVFWISWTSVHISIKRQNIKHLKGKWVVELLRDEANRTIYPNSNTSGNSGITDRIRALTRENWLA